eukprot:11146730-Alexandrium_andersonii.AAC.1
MGRAPEIIGPGPWRSPKLPRPLEGLPSPLSGGIQNQREFSRQGAPDPAATQLRTKPPGSRDPEAHKL